MNLCLLSEYLASRQAFSFLCFGRMSYIMALSIHNLTRKSIRNKTALRITAGINSISFLIVNEILIQWFVTIIITIFLLVSGISFIKELRIKLFYFSLFFAMLFLFFGFILIAYN